MKKKYMLGLAMVFIVGSLFVGCTTDRIDNGSRNDGTTRDTRDGLDMDAGPENKRDITGYNDANGRGTDPQAGLDDGLGARVGYGDNVTNDYFGTMIAPNTPNAGAYNRSADNNYMTRGERISDRVEKIDGVKHAVSIVMGDTCYVGVDMTGYNGADDKTKMSQIKSQIEKQVKAADADVKRVVVTSEDSTFANLKGMYEDMKHGKTTNDFRNDLNKITSNF